MNTTPVVVDTKLAEAYQAAGAVKRTIAQKQSFIANYEKLQLSYSAQAIAGLELEIAKLEAQLAPITATIAELNAQYTGWTRAFLVATGNGHVHRSMHCSTCFVTTEFVWLPEFSGKDEAEIIDAAGSSACTVCYPDAPVDTLRQASRIEAPAKKAAREEREAKAAAKAAKEAITGITNPDGSALVIDRSVIKTERTAQIEGVDAMYWALVAQHEANRIRHEANAAVIAEALAFKRGTSVEEQMELLTAKARKKVAA